MKKFSQTIFLVFCFVASYSQNVTIIPSGITPLQTGNSYPRISYTQIQALPSPARGDLAYDLTFNCLRVFNGTKWLNLLTGLDLNQPATSAWAISTQGFSGINRIEKDANGNIYALGNYTQSATFGSTTLTSLGDNDIFLAKYSESGTLIWIKSFGSPAGDVANALEIDATGNVIISGYFWDNINFDGTILNFTGGGSDICLAKLNSNGVVQWAKKMGGMGIDIPADVETDASGNVYITGNYNNGSITFNGSPNIVLSNAGLYDGFLAKYDNIGNVVYAKNIGAIDDNTVGDLEPSGSNMLLTGSYSGTVTLGNGVSLTSFTGGRDSFLATFDLNGNCQSSISLGSSQASISKILSESSTFFYIAGSVSGTTNIGGQQVNLNPGSSSFFAKVSSSLSVLFVKALPCPQSSSASSMKLDANGNLNIVGNFTGSITNYNNTLQSKGESDVFLAKFSPSGSPLSLLGFGSSGYESGSSIVTGSTIYISGIFMGNPNFGNGITNSGPSPNAYILRISE